MIMIYMTNTILLNYCVYISIIYYWHQNFKAFIAEFMILIWLIWSIRINAMNLNRFILYGCLIQLFYFILSSNFVDIFISNPLIFMLIILFIALIIILMIIYSLSLQLMISSIIIIFVIHLIIVNFLIIVFLCLIKIFIIFILIHEVLIYIILWSIGQMIFWTCIIVIFRVKCLSFIAIFLYLIIVT